MSRPRRTCTVEDCDRGHLAVGYCNVHYRRFKRHGSTEKKPAIRPLAEVLGDPDSTDRSGDCWEWRGVRNRDGYGVISRGRGNKKVLAHRAAYAEWVDPIPEGMVVMHSCDNPPCVNPEHLTVGTQRDNIRDMAAKRRGQTYMSDRYGGMCKQNLHDITKPGALYEGPGRNGSTHLGCLECRRDRLRRYRAKGGKG